MSKVNRIEFQHDGLSYTAKRVRNYFSTGSHWVILYNSISGQSYVRGSYGQWHEVKRSFKGLKETGRSD